MTALPQPPRHPLTVAEYAALDETDLGRYELQEGSLLVSPSRTPHHMRVMRRLIVQLEGQIPGHLELLPDVDIDLELTPPQRPGWSRRPDLVVVRQSEFERVGREGGLLRGAEVVLVVEIVSPGSHRTDHVIKHGEYADAGIPRYWIVDIDDPISLIDCHLAESFGYRDASAATGVFTATEPFSAILRLDELR